MSHKKPPPVVPYSRHVQGKKNLVQSLDAMNNPDNVKNRRFSAEVPLGVLLSFSPPDTPPNDLSENASVNSKDSTDGSHGEVLAPNDNPGEVLTAKLVDLSQGLSEVEEEKAEQEGSPDASETDSESVISSSSSEAPPTSVWDDIGVLTNRNIASPSPPPPIPPPRSKRHDKKSPQLLSDLEQTNLDRASPLVPATGSGRAGPLINVSSADQMNKHTPLPHINYPPRFGPRASPFDDLGSSIASALIDTSKRHSDPHHAGVLTNAGMDLFKAMDNNGRLSPQPSQNNAGSTTDAANDPWKPITPQQTTLSRAKKLPPPIKPHPYGGSGVQTFLKTDTDKATSDPFSNLDLFGTRGMKEYAKSDKSSS